MAHNIFLNPLASACDARTFRSASEFETREIRNNFDVNQKGTQFCAHFSDRRSLISA